MITNKIASFVGASGTGKSTLLNLLAQNPNIKTVELSARPYLPASGDYVQNSSDLVQYKTNYGSMTTMLNALLSSQEETIFFSRCAIDRLAYSRALGGVGHEFDPITIKDIVENVIPNIEVFYLPIEFDLPDGDEVRGRNEEARKAVDVEIQKILSDFDIPYTVVSGTIEERMETIAKKLYESKKNTEGEGRDNSRESTAESSPSTSCGKSGCTCKQARNVQTFPEKKSESIS
jgi:predicted ATPase